MAPGFWTKVNQVIDDADIILLVLDGRLIKETRNKEIENKVKEIKKPLIYVVTKCDLADRPYLEKYRQRLRPSIFTSSKDKYGTKELRDLIYIVATKHKIKGDIKVGVLGYPNVGKSSLINAMRGRNSAPTSALSGYTKGIQKIKTSKNILMLDTPGVIPSKDRDLTAQSMTGTIDYTKTKEPEMVVFELMEQFPGVVEKHYSMPIKDDFEEFIDALAVKKNILKKGAEPDTARMARTILTDWQKGKIKQK